MIKYKRIAVEAGLAGLLAASVSACGASGPSAQCRAEVTRYSATTAHWASGRNFLNLSLSRATSVLGTLSHEQKAVRRDCPAHSHVNTHGLRVIVHLYMQNRGIS
jgi:hypothetical protein